MWLVPLPRYLLIPFLVSLALFIFFMVSACFGRNIYRVLKWGWAVEVKVGCLRESSVW